MPAKKTSSPAKAKPKAASPRVPTPQELAAFLGVVLAKPLDTSQIQKLRKALPGYSNVLDDAAELYAADVEVLAIKGVSEAALLEVKRDQRALAAREAVAQAVYRSIYEQRMVVDDRGIELLQKIARRVAALAEDDPGLPVRWKPVLEFLEQFRGGGRPLKAPAPPLP